MKTFVTKIVILFGMLCGLPLLGVWIAGFEVRQYLEFPPVTRYVQHAPFSWKVFCIYAFLILAWSLPLLWYWVTHRSAALPNSATRKNFPWWGWIGIGLLCVSWILAWTRFQWFSVLQRHSFTPLWIGLILIVNALCYKRTGSCLMTARPRFFILLFPVSAFFWWFFEYLNRFVQNWYYVNNTNEPFEYFLFATLPFSTVLPAVLSVREWMLRSHQLDCFSSFIPIKTGHPRSLALGMLVLAGLGLAGIGVWPNLIFSLLWVSPLLIIVAVETFLSERHILSDFVDGDWHVIIASTLAALVCGFFWEMWNMYSLSRWIYSVPYVHVFKIFEMPLLGWAGYLPFGLECAVVGSMVDRILIKHQGPKTLKN